MTLSEMESLRKQFPTAWAVMMDRLWEVDRALLIELVLQHMSAGDCLVAITAIHKDVLESREEEAINGTKH